MYMRYTGGGIGHRSTRKATEHLEVEIRRLWGSRLRLNDGSDSSDSGSQSESSSSSSDEADDDENEDPFASVGDELDGHETEPEDESDDGLQSDEDNPQMDDGECEQETESSLGYEI
ncbi:hypothetical protein H0H92_014802 [Tricholoma furcatifolium]|nr:hypothetical protein H0H92_014802 [Tricholoma furcatifolium]